jgi:hypothetical protein
MTDAVAEAPPFLSLDFLYVPSKDPVREFTYYTETLGAQPLFRIRHEATVVAGVRLSREGPLVLLAGHLEGDQPILIYRVADLHAARRQLEQRGWQAEDEFEIPHGPICTFTAEGGQQLAIYELTRPQANEHFIGRFDT